MKNKAVSKYAYFLVLIGGINLGIFGLLRLDAIKILFGRLGLADFVYILIGLSALYLLIINPFKIKK